MAIWIPEQYDTFSGADTVLTLLFPSLPQVPPQKLSNFTTLSVSTYRSVKAVPLLGRVNPGGFVKGPRLVGGTLVSMATQTEHWVARLARQIPELQGLPALKPDMLPPCDIVITAATEYGATGRAVIYGVRFLDDGQVISTEDTATENVCSFQASAYQPMQRYGEAVKTPALNRLSAKLEVAGF